MPSRSDWINPALKLLSENLDGVLPATGGAVQDMEMPDIDEIEDMLINKENKEITEFLENPTPSINDLYKPVPPIFRAENHFYRYFIDGSIRTYYLATGLEGYRSFPIELAQIGAAVMQRDERGTVRPLEVQNRILLLLPKGPLGISDTVWNALKKLNTPDGFFQVIDTTEKNANVPQDPSIENLRTRAGGIARNRMHKLEIAIIEKTDQLRGEEKWLILDGAVKLDEFINSPYLIGVAKNFRKDPEFRFGKSPNARKDITSMLASLPYAHRTAAFSSQGGKVAFWYVRLREQKEVDYP